MGRWSEIGGLRRRCGWERSVLRSDQKLAMMCWTVEREGLDVWLKTTALVLLDGSLRTSLKTTCWVLLGSYKVALEGLKAGYCLRSCRWCVNISLREFGSGSWEDLYEGHRDHWVKIAVITQCQALRTNRCIS